MDILENRPLPEKYLQGSSKDYEDDILVDKKEKNRPAVVSKERKTRTTSRVWEIINKATSKYSSAQIHTGDIGCSRNEHIPTALVSPCSSSIQRSPSHRQWVEPRLRQTNSVEDLLHRPSREASTYQQFTDTGLNKWNSYTSIDKDEFNAMNITLDQTQFEERERPVVSCAPIQSNLTSVASRVYNGTSTASTLHHSSSQPTSLYSHSRDVHGVRTRPPYHEAGLHSHAPPSQVMIDMTQWQQQQHNPPNLYGTSHIKAGRASPSINTDPDKFDPLIRGASNMVKEKDSIIERQREEIMQLNYELNVYKQQEEISRAQEQSERLNLQIQEYQYENTQLKMYLADSKNKENSEIEKISRKLGKAEDELRQFQMKAKKDNTMKIREREEMQKKVDQQKTMIVEWEAKYLELKEEHSKLRQRNMALEGYMSDLPSAEDHSNNSKELASLARSHAEKEAQISGLHQQVAELRETLKIRNSHIASLETTENNLSAEISQYKKKYERVHRQLFDKQKSEKGESGALYVPQEEVDKLKQDNQKLRQDVNRAKKKKVPTATLC